MTDELPGDATEVERATIEIEADGHSPRGGLITADGRRRAFAGWAELGAALEDWRAAARRRRFVEHATDGAIPRTKNERTVP
jgi:hypothetical protein